MKIPVTVLSVVTTLTLFAAAQTITVDVSHSANHFVPSETLGAGVDRIPAAAIVLVFCSTGLKFVSRFKGGRRENGG